MSHIDDGALHAYLDGALEDYAASEAKHVREHLETCGACAQRLEEERGIRNRATSILALATPQVETPSFEELKAYVQATRPAKRRVSVRLYRLGWAASVVLALGVGWMARGGELDPAVTPGGLTTAPDAPRQSVAETAESSDASAAPIGPGDAPETAAGAGGAVASADRLGEEVAKAAPPAVAGQRAGLERVAAADLLADRDQPAPPEEGREIEAEADLAIAARTRAEDVASAMDSGVAITPPAPRQEGLRTDAVLVDVPETVTIVVTGSTADATARAEEERARAPVTTQLDVAATAPAPVAGARAFADPPAAVVAADDALAVPGVELLSYANLAEGRSPAGIHVVQRLENGEILDVYHLPEGVDPSALPPVEPVRNEVRAQRDGGWVVLRARLSTEELAALLARLVPEG